MTKKTFGEHHPSQTVACYVLFYNWAWKQAEPWVEADHSGVSWSLLGRGSLPSKSPRQLCGVRPILYWENQELSLAYAPERLGALARVGNQLKAHFQECQDRVAVRRQAKRYEWGGWRLVWWRRRCGQPGQLQCHQKKSNEESKDPKGRWVATYLKRQP